MLFSPRSSSGVVSPDLRIVGSTVVPDVDDLPMRLSAVIQDQEGTYFLHLADSTSGPVLQRVSPGWIRQNQEEDDYLSFETPIPLQPDHVLIQVLPSAQPHYLPQAALDVLLREVADEALQHVARRWKTGRDQAEARAWYAVRAQPDDPLPLLLGIALGRPHASPDARALMREDVQGLPRDSLHAIPARIEKMGSLGADLWEILQQDPFVMHSISVSFTDSINRNR